MEDNPKKVKTTIVLYPWIRQGIKLVAARTNQQMSDLISDALIEKLAEYGINPPQSYKDLSDLIDSHYDWLLEQTVLTDQILKPISEGQKADHVTLLRLALALEMSEDEVRELNERQRIQGNRVTQEKKRSAKK